MTGYRTGFIAGDADVIERFRQYRSNPGVVPSQFVNEAAAIAWADDDHVAARRRIFTAKKELFLSFFDSIQWPTIGREASLYLWVKVPAGDSAESWALRLLNQGVVVSQVRCLPYRRGTRAPSNCDGSIDGRMQRSDQHLENTGMRETMKERIEACWGHAPDVEAVEATIEALDKGEIRVAEQKMAFGSFMIG